MQCRVAAVVLALLLPALASAQGFAEQTAVRYLQDNWNRHSLEQADVADLIVTDRVPAANGIEVVYLRQSVDGIQVASGPMTVALDRNGRVFHATGRLTSDLSRKVTGNKSASLSAAAAVNALASSVGVTPSEPFATVSQKAGDARATIVGDGGIARLPVQAQLVWAEDGNTVRLAWETTIYLKNGGDWFGHVDASTGRVIRSADLLVRDNWGPAPEATPVALTTTPRVPLAAVPTAQAPWAVRAGHAVAGGATYRAYPMPIESPLYSSPASPADARVLISGAEDALASPFGWHDTDGVPGAEFTITRGNNTHAYLDRNDSESPDPDGEPDGGASLMFDFPLDFTQGPLANKEASVTNLFVWSNIVHDLYFRYGFDEQSGNFQATNYTGQGAGGDAVDSESQSGADICNEFSPCDTNANFSTPADGSEPRMQMYIGSNPDPDIDGVFDHTVVAHEYGHGISNRLTGGPSQVACLRNAEQMGEGWSDFFGLVMTIEPGDVGTDRRPVGNYLLGQPITGGGIRGPGFQPAPGAPYSTDFAINSATYGNTNSGLSQPHGIGFAWSVVLWEATWELIEDFGYSDDIYNADGMAGNQVMINLVMNGLKLQPCSPGFVDGRDAILAADQAIYGGIHTDALWEAFARRGLGFGASQGSSDSRSDQVESFIVPESIPPSPITDLAAVPNGDFVTLTFTATGDDGTVGAAAEYQARRSASPILTEADWEAATPVLVSATPSESGTAESVEATGLAFSTEYHFAMKVIDDAFNVSDLSNSASATTLGPPDLQVSMDPVTFMAPVGGNATAQVAIGNTGASDLRYSLSLAEAEDGLQRRRDVYASGAAARLAAAPEAPADKAVKGAPEASGDRRENKDAGGPDAFGYSWIDSDETGGPTYDWVDISTTGTDLTLGDDTGQQVALPFAFPFYDSDKTSVSVASNGYLTFGSVVTDFSNNPIPSTGTVEPNDALYPYWDDLDPANAGTAARILYQDMGDGRFVVSWLDVPHWSSGTGGQDGSFTFQAILYSSGAVVFQYEEMDFGASSGESATVGIENADGTDGLQVAHNEAYIEDGLAIRFSAFWGEVISASGRVASGASENVTLRADASGLLPGIYNGEMLIASNDPSATATTVPLRLIVGNSTEPQATVSPSSVTADVPRGDSADRTVTITNTGGADLEWSLADASGSLPDWLAIGTSGGTIAPGASADVTMTMDPGTTYLAGSTQTTTLTMTSNDPTGAISISMTMNVLAGTANEGDLDFEGPYVLGDVAPNPIGNVATTTFAVRETQAVRAEVLDLLGRRVALVHDGQVAAMTRQSIQIDASGLAAGAYVLVVRGETFTASRRITIAR